MLHLFLIAFALHGPAAHTVCSAPLDNGRIIVNSAPLVNGRRLPITGVFVSWRPQVYADTTARVVVRMPPVDDRGGRVCVTAQTQLRHARIRVRVWAHPWR